MIICIISSSLKIDIPLHTSTSSRTIIDFIFITTEEPFVMVIN